MLEELRRRWAALEEQRNGLLAEGDALVKAAETESRSMTPDEDGRFSAAVDEVRSIVAAQTELLAQIDQLEAAERATERAQQAAPFNVNTRLSADPYKQEIRWGAPKSEVRAIAERVLEVERSLTPEQQERALDLVARLDGPSHVITRRMLATGTPEYRSAFGKAAVGLGLTLTGAESAALERAASLTDASGGFAVPFVLDPTIIDTGNGSVNPFRMISRVEQTIGDNWQGVSSAGVTASWDAEAAEVSDDAPTLAQPAVPPHKASAFVPFSIEIGQDWQGMETEIRRMIFTAKDDLEAVAFATGTGSGQPTGIVTALVAGAGTVPLITSSTAEQFTAPDIYKMHNAIPSKFEPRASWVANKSIYNLVRQFDSNGGSALWERIGAGRPPELMGYPAYEASAIDGTFDATATATNYVLILGDFSNYVIVDRIGLQFELVPMLLATANNRPNGQRGIYAHWRVGADSVNDNAFRLLNLATTA